MPTYMPLKTFQAIRTSVLWGTQFFSMYELRCHSGEDVKAWRSRFSCRENTLLTAACVPSHFLWSVLVMEQTSCGVGTMQSSDSQSTGHGRVISLSSKIAPRLLWSASFHLWVLSQQKSELILLPVTVFIFTCSGRHAYPGRGSQPLKRSTEKTSQKYKTINVQIE